MKHSLRKFPVFFLIFIYTSALFAQDTTGKKEMTIDDYKLWRNIVSTSISSDGSWLSYTFRKPQADDTLYVKNTITDKSTQIPGGTGGRFSEDAKWIAYTINVPFQESEKLKKDKKPVPKKIQLLHIESGEKFTWNNASSFSFSRDSRYFAVKKAKSDKDAKHTGTNVILKSLESRAERLIGSVSVYKFNKPGNLMAFTVDAADKSGNGVYLIRLVTGVQTTLDHDTLTYAQLAWDEKGNALAVLKGEKKKGFSQKDNTLIAFTGLQEGTPAKSMYDPKGAFDFPKDMVISENGALAWSEDYGKVFHGIKEQEVEPEKKKDAKPVPNVDLFHWKDDRIQTVQEKSAARDKRYTYRSVFNLKDKRFVRLADESMKNISVTQNGKWAIGWNNKPYVSDWKEYQADYYRVNTDNGERAEILKGQKRTLNISPDSKHFLYWKDSHVWNYNIDSNKSTNLTESAPVSFVNKEFDRVGTKPPYGVAGFTKDKKSVILYHKNDIWLQPLNGGNASNLTAGVGDEDEIRLRYVKLDPEEKFIDLSKPMLLAAFGQWTKKSGYFEWNKGKTTPLIFEDKRISRISKAKNADIYAYTIESFEDFPNYYVSDTRFTFPKRITDANPHQAEYKWGKRILFEYTNKDGVRLQGTLAIPEDYKPGDNYPMLVQFYEKYSQNLHAHYRPVYRDTPQFAKYVSQGYLVMQPDVHFNTRTTHSDMLDCVTAATRKVIEMGYADPEKIGMHGHSFSGGGSSFIATQTRMFKAIASGAAPINLAGEFNILFRGSGQNNHRYDIYGQGRYGTDPYTDFELYRQQSPITHAKNMDTPLLYLHGTADGSVEYLQGMEWYNALRFLGKPVIFASYPGAGHHLRKIENQIDYQTKMEQFFDHYLKGKPAPKWMTDGVPFLKKEANKK